MMKVNERITFNWDEVVKIFKELELVVVSLDKIGSYNVDNDEMKFQNNLTNFIVDWKIGEKLAEARKVISEKIDDTLGEDDMDDLERAMENLKYWNKPGDKPDVEANKCSDGLIKELQKQKNSYIKHS